MRAGRTYRITGRPGDMVYTAFTLYGGAPNAGSTRIVSHICDTDMAFEEDGSFEVLLSAEEPDKGNWLPLEEDAFALVVRQYFADRPEDRATRVEADLDVEVVGAGPPSPPVEDSPLGDRLRLAGETVLNIARLTAFAMQGIESRPNEATVNISGALPAALFPTPDNHYIVGWFQLEPDGAYRFVLAARDPGVPNWLDTDGHTEGFVAFRWMNAESHPESPTFRVLPLDDIA